MPPFFATPKHPLLATLAFLFPWVALASSETAPATPPFIAAHSPEIATPFLPQPSSHVVDRRNVLSIRQRSDLGTLLHSAATKDDISIYILVLRDAPTEGVETYFTALAEQWDTQRLTAFVVCHTDEPRELKSGVHIIPGNVPTEGKLRNNLLTAANNATLFAHNQRNIPDAIEAGAFEILEQYKNILSGKPLTPPALTPLPSPASHSSKNAPTPKQQDLLPLLKEFAPAIIPVLLVAALSAAVVAFRTHRRRYIFPVPEFRYRLCAPFSGGNSARIDYRLKHRQPPPS
ncbi:MAG: hypothetical protein AAF591_09940 [Verrucomicrobiota bacterium]